MLSLIELFGGAVRVRSSPAEWDSAMPLGAVSPPIKCDLCNIFARQLFARHYSHYLVSPLTLHRLHYARIQHLPLRPHFNAFPCEGERPPFGSPTRAALPRSAERIEPPQKSALGGCLRSQRRAGDGKGPGHSPAARRRQENIEEFSITSSSSFFININQL